MNYRLLLLPLVLVIALSSGKAAELPADAEIEKLLVGKWVQEEMMNGITIKATTTYEKDGKLSGEATINAGDRMIKIVVLGSWKMTMGKLTETIDRSEPPTIPAGKTSTDELLEINKKICRYRAEDGTERTKTRVAE